MRSLPLLWWLLCPVPRRVFPAAARAAVRALCRRWARVLHLCSRPACLAACCFCAWSACLVFFRFCEGFHACRLFARSVCCLCGFFLSIFALFCLNSSSQKAFHLSLRPRRASTFFRKESRQRFAKGLRPFEPHSCALRPIFSFSALLAGLRGLSGRKPPADGETLEKPRSRAQLFKRFCAKENACALRLISPFFSLLAGLHGPSGRKPPADRGNARKAKGAKLSFSGVSVRGGCAGAFTLPQETVAQRGRTLGNSRGRVRLGEKRGRANRFAGGRRTTGCIAGDKAACADSPAPGRRVRELPAAGWL